MMEQLNINKSDWKLVRFGDVVFEPKENSKDPIADGIERVVGLEHIESENIHLTSWASIEEATTFTKVFRAGDVLFGRRRAYLKKAAQATFDGICSGDITVFRAKKSLLPELLPFLVSSESFFDYAIKHSAGGLSPRVKFKDLSNYEFLLPPKDQQAQLAELLWAMNETMNTSSNTFMALDLFFRAKRRDLVYGSSKITKHFRNIGDLPNHWEVDELDKYFDRVVEKNKDCKSDNVLTISAQDGLVNQEEYFKRQVASKDLSPYYLLYKDDFAYNKSYSDGYPAGAIKSLKKYQIGVVSPLYICFRCRLEQAYKQYYEHLFDSGFLDSQILSVAKEGARNHGLLNVSTSDFFRLLIPKPTLEEVSLVNNELEEIKKRVDLAHKQVVHTQSLQKSLINQVFG